MVDKNDPKLIREEKEGNIFQILSLHEGKTNLY